MELSNPEQRVGLTPTSRFFKRSFDIIFSALGLILTGWLILIAFLLAAWDTGENGFFRQERVGKDGRLFKVIKIRTMRSDPTINTTVTSAADPRITRLGRFWRKTKVDELPQLINILPGQMSFVGPRPDVPGFADRLLGADRIILSVRPGITGPAALRFRHEETLLASQPDPERYNREIIYPEKVRINRSYIENYSFWSDLRYIWQTIAGGE
jgi:lipopolysaccharide/colanic/teichoic acid biosynthesis glycosyltransferase